MSLRILLADESSMIKKAFELGLNSYGAEIRNVQHGIDVLEVAESFNPDIIFADVLISKMNGYEVCAQIKQHERLSHTPVVLMWSGFMDIDEDKYFTCHADGKIEKPFSAEQLLDLIQSLVVKPISQNTSQYSQNNEGKNQPPSLGKKPTTPADDLLFKEDLKPNTDGDLFNDLNDTLDSSNADEDVFGLGDFQALDLHTNKSDQSHGFDLSDEDSDLSTASDADAYDLDINSFETEELNTTNNDDVIDIDINSLDENVFGDTEITEIPTEEQEQAMLKKLDEDTAIRHGSGFLNAELQDELSNPSIQIESQQALNKVKADNLNKKSQIIHRDVEDIHNSDAGLLSSSDQLISDTKNSNEVSSNPALKQLSNEEIKEIIKEQAKEIIQNIVWEMVPEISKQMIEKEIKRLLADSEDAPPNKNF